MHELDYEKNGYNDGYRQGLYQGFDRGLSTTLSILEMIQVSENDKNLNAIIKFIKKKQQVHQQKGQLL
jgi:hypothetical protein